MLNRGYKAIQTDRPVEKAGKKMSGKNRETLKGIYESLGAFLREFDEPEPEEKPRKRGRPKKTDTAPEGGQPARGVYEEIRDLYNTICTSFPKVRSLSEARKKAIKARMANGYTVDSFRELFQRAQASSFLKGKNDRNWQATFDWLIKDSNMAKVIDGNYEDKGGGGYGPYPDRGNTGRNGSDPGGFKPSGGFKGSE